MAVQTRAKPILEDRDRGGRFVTLVIVMMSALATLALGGALVVSALRGAWVGALDGQMTIEIPADDGQGTIREAATLQKTAQDVGAALRGISGVAAIRVLNEKEVEKLVEPWLGSIAGTKDLPLPALIGVTFDHAGDPALPGRIDAVLRGIDPAATTETHAAWLSDLRRFSLVLLLATAAMAAATIACCTVTVAGAVTAGLSEHASDIDLLHLMGATDTYIARQFIDLSVRGVGKAALIGTGAGFLLLKGAGAIAGTLESAALPGFAWTPLHYLYFLALPALVTALCFLAARRTVLHSLRAMP